LVEQTKKLELIKLMLTVKFTSRFVVFRPDWRVCYSVDSFNLIQIKDYVSILSNLNLELVILVVL